MRASIYVSSVGNREIEEFGVLLYLLPGQVLKVKNRLF